jgi:predicted nuclease with RNAse H fold
MLVAGIDLAGKPGNPTGFCVFRDSSSETKLLGTDEEIIGEVKALKPECIAIDAPFWIPRSGLRVVPWRNCERRLIERGFRPLSPALPTMQELVGRASALVKQLREMGFTVIEVFPKASESIFGLSKEEGKNEHEYEALLCALTAVAFVKGNYEDLDGIVIPR